MIICHVEWGSTGSRLHQTSSDCTIGKTKNPKKAQSLSLEVTTINLRTLLRLTLHIYKEPKNQGWFKVLQICNE